MKEGMVHKTLREAAVLLALTLVLAGCSKSESSQAVGPGAAGNTLVTFVELGSVGCIPCRMMQPIMREIEGTYSGQVRVVFHDVWTEEGKPYIKKFGIRVIPTRFSLTRRVSNTFDTKGSFPRNNWWQCLRQKA